MAEGSIIIEVDDEEYHRVVEELKFSVVGKLNLKRGDPIPTTMEISRKLCEFWKIPNLKVIPLGEGTFHVLLCNLKDRCKALSVSSVFLKQDFLRINRWVPGYSSIKQGSIS